MNQFERREQEMNESFKKDRNNAVEEKIFEEGCEDDVSEIVGTHNGEENGGSESATVEGEV